MEGDGRLHPHLRQVDGLELAATNFVLTEPGDRSWVTVSTRHWPLSSAFIPGTANGYIVLINSQGARIVADGLGFANEVRVHPDGAHLYVAETFAHSITRFRIDGDSLCDRELVVDLGPRRFPDGIAFDSEGHLWVASLMSNEVLRVAPRGDVSLMLEDTDSSALNEVVLKRAAGTLVPRDVQALASSRLHNVSCVAFGGPDLRTIFLGSLGGDELISFRSPVPGHPPPHWKFSLPGWAR